MLKKILLILSFGALLLPCGCNTPRPYIYSWPHNKRKIQIILDAFHEAHMDFDRIVFDMEERPLEEL